MRWQILNPKVVSTICHLEHSTVVLLNNAIHESSILLQVSYNIAESEQQDVDQVCASMQQVFGHNERKTIELERGECGMIGVQIALRPSKPGISPVGSPGKIGSSKT